MLLEKPSAGIGIRIKKAITKIGPGLVTGASDDDPSGIATYSQAGARFGIATLWTALVTFPLMAAIQEMCARIGLVTSVGLTTTLKKHYPPWLLYLMMAVSIPAIILNIGADIAGMGAVANLIFPSIKPYVFSIIFTAVLLFIIIYLPYERMVGILKYLCLALLCYLIVPFLSHTEWSKVVRATFIPTIHLNKEFFMILVAILGTTISPYLFFWQVTMEAEDAKGAHQLILARRKIIRSVESSQPAVEREKNFFRLLIRKMQADVNIGMMLSNLVMYFIILTSGTLLYSSGIRQIDTIEQAAKALEPVAGKSAYLLFAVGVIGTGLLAIPVLSGSLSYIVAETVGWKGDLNKPFAKAKPFYFIIILSLLVGLGINFLHISPIDALVYTALLYGISSPVMIVLILLIGNNRSIMGEYTNGRLSNILGIITLLLMTASAIALIYFQVT